MRKHARIAALLALTGAFSCRCIDDEPTAIAPQIYLDVCKVPQRTVDGVLIGGFEECAVDFGERDISVKVTHNIKVSNPSLVDLLFEKIEIVGDPSFKVEVAPDRIASGFQGEIVVSVRPRTETTIESKLRILSNANNTQQTEDNKSLIEIPLTATGVDNGVPDILVSPPRCDYGRVAHGGVLTCNVEVTNEGNRALVLDEVAFVPVGDDPAVLFVVPEGSTAEPFAFTGRPPGPDEEIGAHDTVPLQVRFTPDVDGNYQGLFHILSNDPDPDEELIEVPLSGVAVPPPVCAIKVKSVNGVEATGAGIPDIEPLDNVVLSLEDSEPSTPNGSIVRYQWSIGRRPAGSGVVLTTELEETTGFSFDNGDNLGVDVAGEYTIRAVVFDDLDVGSVNECELTFEAIPKDNFLVQLTWDTDTNDMDLHVTKQDDAGQYCIDSISGSIGNDAFFSEACQNELDCNWTRRTAEWDGVAGTTSGDPSLDVDDITGFGPENINIDVMEPGLYLVGVAGYSTDAFENPVSGNTVRLFVFGRLAGEFFVELEEFTWAEIALVEWPANQGDPVCIEDLTDGDATDDFERCHNGG